MRMTGCCTHLGMEWPMFAPFEQPKNLCCFDPVYYFFISWLVLLRNHPAYKPGSLLQSLGDDKWFLGMFNEGLSCADQPAPTFKARRGKGRQGRCARFIAVCGLLLLLLLLSFAVWPAPLALHGGIVLKGQLSSPDGSTRAEPYALRLPGACGAWSAIMRVLLPTQPAWGMIPSKHRRQWRISLMPRQPGSDSRSSSTGGLRKLLSVSQPALPASSQYTQNMGADAGLDMRRLFLPRTTHAVPVIQPDVLSPVIRASAAEALVRMHAVLDAAAAPPGGDSRRQAASKGSAYDPRACSYATLWRPILNSGQSGMGIGFVCQSVLCAMADAADAFMASRLANAHPLEAAAPGSQSPTLNIQGQVTNLRHADNASSAHKQTSHQWDDSAPSPRLVLPAYYMNSGLRTALTLQLMRSCSPRLAVQALAFSAATPAELRACGAAGSLLQQLYTDLDLINRVCPAAVTSQSQEAARGIEPQSALSQKKLATPDTTTELGTAGALHEIACRTRAGPGNEKEAAASPCMLPMPAMVNQLFLATNSTAEPAHMAHPGCSSRDGMSNGNKSANSNAAEPRIVSTHQPGNSERSSQLPLIQSLGNQLHMGQATGGKDAMLHLLPAAHSIEQEQSQHAAQQSLGGYGMPIQPNSWWVAGYPTSWRAGCYCGQTPGDWSPVCSTAPPRFYPSACYARCQGVASIVSCQGLHANMHGWALGMTGSQASRQPSKDQMQERDAAGMQQSMEAVYGSEHPKTDAGSARAGMQSSGQAPGQRTYFDWRTLFISTHSRSEVLPNETSSTTQEPNPSMLAKAQSYGQNFTPPPIHMASQLPASVNAASDPTLLDAVMQSTFHEASAQSLARLQQLGGGRAQQPLLLPQQALQAAAADDPAGVPGLLLSVPRCSAIYSSSTCTGPTSGTAADTENLVTQYAGADGRLEDESGYYVYDFGYDDDDDDNDGNTVGCPRTACDHASPSNEQRKAAPTGGPSSLSGQSAPSSQRGRVLSLLQDGPFLVGPSGFVFPIRTTASSRGRAGRGGPVAIQSQVPGSRPGVSTAGSSGGEASASQGAAAAPSAAVPPASEPLRVLTITLNGQPSSIVEVDNLPRGALTFAAIDELIPRFIPVIGKA